MRRLELPDNVQVTMQVWDIGGQSIFSKMITTYIFEANAVSVISTVHQIDDVFQMVIGRPSLRYNEPVVLLRFGRLAGVGEANLRGS